MSDEWKSERVKKGNREEEGKRGRGEEGKRRRGEQWPVGKGRRGEEGKRRWGVGSIDIWGGKLRIEKSGGMRDLA
ncbi:MAG: hypothetical protein KA746_09670 [Pyrinomonadaceae bacterium]|nr:hypothetical protein [Pyrinomonadaceae bacterium]MBP6212717.1 hypothetical protein [Pyrinomonadaceae bacterium]